MNCPRILLRAAAISALFLGSAWGLHAQSPCVDGLVLGTYPCENVELLAHLPNAQFDNLLSNDIWGWTDPLDGSEYVLVPPMAGGVRVPERARSCPGYGRPLPGKVGPWVSPRLQVGLP